MNTRLCDLVEVITNNRSCVLLKIKDDTAPIELIKLGFDGNETLLRLMKDPTNPSVTIFHEEGQPITMNYGSSTTVVSGPLRAMRDQIIETVTLDFGIFVSGYPRHGKSYDEARECPFTETVSQINPDVNKKPPIQIGEIEDGLVYPGHLDMGPIFVDEAAFNAKEGVCYIPVSGFEDVTGDEEPGGYPLEICSFYTHQDFMELCDGSQETAQALFDQLDGRSPETIILEVRALSLDQLIQKAKEKSTERNACLQQLSPKNHKSHGPEL